jgi:hypothetical protein
VESLDEGNTLIVRDLSSWKAGVLHSADLVVESSASGHHRYHRDDNSHTAARIHEPPFSVYPKSGEALGNAALDNESWPVILPSALRD